jgi:hypothetical protein
MQAIIGAAHALLDVLWCVLIAYVIWKGVPSDNAAPNPTQREKR